MDVLFVISVVCFFALFVTALAIARHVRIEQAPNRRHAPDPPATRERATLETSRTEQNLGNLAQLKQPDWRFLVSAERRRVPYPDALSRKPPASVRTPPRPDWAYFNQDLGDLSDPYQPSSPLATFGTASSNRHEIYSRRRERTS